ncbi:MAG: DUF4468 domain-containing protein [Segetibacter sp.]
MKNLIFVVYMLIVQASFGQKVLDSIPTKEGKPFYEKIIKVDSFIKKETLFSLSKQWFAKAFTNSKQLIETEDKEIGLIIATLPIHFNLGFGRGNALIKETMKIEFKDGKMRVQIDGFAGKQLKGTSEQLVSDLNIYEAYDELKQGKIEKKNEKVFTGLNVYTNFFLSDLEKFVKEKSKSNDF